MGLLPKGYDPEVAGGSSNSDLYIKLEMGENKFRFLDILPMFEYWTVEGKPQRLTVKPSFMPFNARLEGKFGAEKVKHVWACTVYSYKHDEVKILQLTQKSVQTALANLDADPDWEDLSRYDVKITRSGSGMETEYTVIQSVPKDVTKGIQAKIDSKPVNLTALLYNADPCGQDWETKALENILTWLDHACTEAAEREIDATLPATTDLGELLKEYENLIMKLPTITPIKKTPVVEETPKEAIAARNGAESASDDGNIPF